MLNTLAGIIIGVAVGTVFAFVNSKGKTESEHFVLPLIIAL